MSVQRGRLAGREAGSTTPPWTPASCCRSWPRARSRAWRRWSTACTGGAWPTGAPRDLRPATTDVAMAGDERAARAILRLDADPDAIARPPRRRSAARPARSAPRRAAASPGHPDPAELAVRALLGQQISVAAARTLAGRLVAAARRAAGRGRVGRHHASLPRHRRRSRRSTRRRCRCRAPAPARSCGMAGDGRSARTCRDRAVDGRLRRAALRRRRRVPPHRPRRQARARRARRRPGAGRGARRGVARRTGGLRGRPHLWAAATSS